MGNPIAWMAGITLGNCLYSGGFKKDWPRAIGTSVIASVIIVVCYMVGWW